MSATACLAPAAPLRPRARSIFLPKEHGSWSLALEPVALGLLVAPSLAAGGLAITATALFFGRRPVKLALDSAAPADRRRAAVGTLLLFAVIAAGGFALAIEPGGLTALWPLALALPFAGLFALFDAQGSGRAAFAEVAGATAFAAIPAACATLAGWSTPAALALGALSLARSVPAVLLVRGCLRRRKYGDFAALMAGPIAAAVALLGIGELYRAMLVPVLAVIAAAVLFLRAVWFTSPVAAAWSAKRVGIAEVFVGLGYLVVLFLGWHLT